MSFLFNLLYFFEYLGEDLVRLLLRLEPRAFKESRVRYWIPIAIAMAFVLMDNFVPSDPRSKLQLTSFTLDTSIGGKSIITSVLKLKHMVFFFVVYIQLRQVWPRRREKRIFLTMLLLALIIELEQAFVSGRHSRPLDLVPNLIGYLLAYWYLKSRDRRGRPNLYSQFESASGR
jgi:VanZ family protein